MFGNVHSIESLGTLDGPGLRTVVFMQGCPLKCKFCHNSDCIPMSDKNRMTSDQLVTQLLRNKHYWNSDTNSNGGVTFSGGEPMLQATFIKECALALKSEGVHIVIDTSLFASRESINELLPYVDLWMVSLKHLDAKIHKELTGVSNEVILENISYLDSILAEDRLRIRYLVIPTITDSIAYQDRLVEYINNLKHLESLEILPYGDHGKYKWIERTGEYLFAHIPVATSEQIAAIKKHMQTKGIKIKT
jgi:pyruvate formate lyase activating enzyme